MIEERYNIRISRNERGEGPKGSLPYQQPDSGQFLHEFTITDGEFHQLTAYIKANYGIHLKEGKKALVISRLRNVLLEHGFRNFSEYYEYIMADKTGIAVATLLDRITTNHTFFMREADHFIFFREKVLPFLANTVSGRDLRIWSAGCSSGEEPYTLAMILDEYFGYEKTRWDTKILATDISGKVLEAAAKGIYNNERIASLPANWKRKYFMPFDSENSILADSIRNEVIFRRFNLMEENFPFRRKFHVIFCRNVMIYFDIQAKLKLINKFYDSLEHGGYLFIGHSESINREQSKYKYIRPAVYRKE